MATGDHELIGAVADTLAHLVNDPYNDPPSTALSILPYQDATRPNSFTVTIGGRALLVYQVMRDHPIIRLQDFLTLD